MNRVLFGQSYFLQFDPKERQSMRPYPPLGTLYAAAYVREHGYDVRVFDSMLAQSVEEWASALDAHKPDFAVIYEDGFNYLSKMCLTSMRAAAFVMIAAAKSRNCTVLVSGSDATDHREKYFDAGAHGVIVGEGEVTLLEALDVLSGKQAAPEGGVPGLYMPIAPAPSPRGFIKNLDSLPAPAWDLLDIERYKTIWMERHGYYSINVVTTRGCPYHCNWCAKPIYGQRYNVRSPESVAAEIRMLKEKYAPDHIWFADDIFGLKPGWIERFAAEVERLDARIPFKCLLRVDLIKGGVPAALRKAGCEIVWVGAESGSQKILDAMEKGTTVEQIHTAARKLHEYGIKIAFFLQFGYPGEDLADIEATLRMVRECEPDDIGMSVSYPLPGTKFYEKVKQEFGDKQNWLDSGDFEMMYAGPYSTAFYRQLHTVLHKEFRIRKNPQHTPGRIASKSGWRDLAHRTRDRATLPLARWQLRRLSNTPGPRFRPLHSVMTSDAAATPTPQLD